MITVIMIMIKESIFIHVTPAHLPFFEVISQVVEKFVKHFKPREITEPDKRKMLIVIVRKTSRLGENHFTTLHKCT